MAENRTLASKFVDPQLEFSLLAALAHTPERYWEIVDLVPPEALTETRRAFEKMAAAIERQERIPTVKDEPKEDLVEIAKKVGDLYQKRLLASLGETFMDELLRGAPPADLVSRLEYRLASVLQAIRDRRSAHTLTLYNLLPKALKQLEAGRIPLGDEGEHIAGLPTGLLRLDRLLGGLRPGLHLLVSEPGQGKTAFCLQIGLNMVRAGFPVLYLNFDDLSYKLAIRAVCQAAELDMDQLVQEEDQLLQLNVAAQKHGADFMKFHFLEGNGLLTVTQVKAKALQILRQQKAPCMLLVVDSFQRWAAGVGNDKDLWSNFCHLVSGLQELSRRLEIPLLVVSTENRPDQGSLNLKNCSGYGGLEHCADSVLFLSDAGKIRTAPPPLPAKAIDLHVEKNRYGETGRIELVLRPNIGQIREVARER